MRAVVQRVHRASVTVDSATVGTIQRGLLVYLGIGKGDGVREREWMLEKIIGLRIFGEDKMNDSVVDVGGKLLLVSQFTLYGDVRKGRRPSFDSAMPPIEAEHEYDLFVQAARARIAVETGRFAADMQVESVNDGPVTIWLDTSAS